MIGKNRLLKIALIVQFLPYFRFKLEFLFAGLDALMGLTCSFLTVILKSFPDAKLKLSLKNFTALWPYCQAFISSIDDMIIHLRKRLGSIIKCWWARKNVYIIWQLSTWCQAMHSIVILPLIAYASMLLM